jgi:hypothetical protein
MASDAISAENLPRATTPGGGPAAPAPVAGNVADAAGVALSIACGVHCLLTPILLIALPALGEAFHRPIVHRVIAIGVTVIAAYALWRGYRRHGHLLPMALGFAGVLTIWAAAFLPHHAHAHDHFHLPAGTIVTMLGSLMLITGHLLNIRTCRAGCCRRPTIPV